jgi:hypothetical protein
VIENYQRRVAIQESQHLIEQMYDLQSPVEETVRETVERTLAKLIKFLIKISQHRDFELSSPMNSCLMPILPRRSNPFPALWRKGAA